ncbi:MAG: histidine kinase, partial [Flavobacterium sp.]
MKSIYRQFWRSLIVGILVFVLLMLIAIANGKTIEWGYGLQVNFLYVMLYSVCLHLANTVVFIGMDRFFGKGRMSVKRLLVGFACSFIVSLFVVFLLRIFEDVVIEGKNFKAFILNEVPGNYYVAMVLTLIITMIVHLVFFYKNYQENKVKEQKIIAGAASAKFESLKNQIDPHFLFNSLNVLSSLIEENPESAQRFTTSLSKVYRYVLEQKDKELVTIQEELAFAKTYMNLLRMRFEDSVSFELPETISSPDAKVVPLSLQLLLENTIKHNVVSQHRPLHIKIFEEDGYLIVQNDYQKKEVLQDGRGVGLQNIISRYGIITSRKVLIEQTREHFTVKIPVLTKQISIMETPITNDAEASYQKAQKRVEEIKGFYG